MSDVLSTLFTNLYIWTNTPMYWLYSLFGLAKDHYIITALIVIGLAIIYKVFFDK